MDEQVGTLGAGMAGGTINADGGEKAGELVEASERRERVFQIHGTSPLFRLVIPLSGIIGSNPVPTTITKPLEACLSGALLFLLSIGKAE